MKALLMTPRVREKELKQLIGDAVELNFNDDLIEDYKSQLLSVLVEIAKEKAKRIIIPPFDDVVSKRCPKESPQNFIPTPKKKLTEEQKIKKLKEGGFI